MGKSKQAETIEASPERSESDRMKKDQSDCDCLSQSLQMGPLMANMMLLCSELSEYVPFLLKMQRNCRHSLKRIERVW